MSAGAPSDGTTMTAVLDRLRGEGYDGDFTVGEGASLACRACGTESAAAEVGVEEIRRLEGASDPADMAAVLALVCPVCSARGTAIVRFGPEAGADDAEVLRAVEDRRG
jgi:hypothetical protein